MVASRATAYLLLGLVLVTGALAVATRANAAVPTYSDTCVSALDPSTCERAEAAVVELDHANEYHELVAYGVWAVFGGVLMLIAAPMMQAAFRWWQA